MKNVQEQLEKARKRLRICLIAVVILAIVAGCAYYFGDFGKERDVTEGTLVRGAQDAQGDVRVLYSSNTTKIHLCHIVKICQRQRTGDGI